MSVASHERETVLLEASSDSVFAFAITMTSLFKPDQNANL
jgi:hypothetical protein